MAQVRDFMGRRTGPHRAANLNEPTQPAHSLSSWSLCTQTHTHTLRNGFGKLCCEHA